MSDGKRLSRPSRRVTFQLLLGVTTIAVSILGVTSIVNQRESTIQVGIVTEKVPAGTPVGELPVALVDVPAATPHLSPLTEADVEASRHLVNSRELRVGDVLSIYDFSSPENLDFATVTIDLEVGEPKWLVRGQSVSVWVAPPASENSFSVPFVLSPHAVVDTVSRDEGFAADGVLRHVDLLVSAREVPGLVHAIANNYFLYLTPNRAP